ncbi:MAG: DUF655 domain-containing protein [Candidatus Helarchaeota archaeon]|nr:DUF655 domain-containing protein [Candidatus Helarchaeota archaeon]
MYNKRYSEKIKDLSKKKYEEYAVVLDFLARGKQKPRDKVPLYAKEPIVQAVGESYFTLLELVPYKFTSFSIRERIFIGKGDKRKKIDHVKKRILHNNLTASAKFELFPVIESIINRKEKRFLNFFNTAKPITTRMHQLELLPGVGKKLMWDIINELKKDPFSDFEDLKQRIKIIDPKKLIAKRILTEIQNETEKHRIFTRPPPS